MTVRVHLNGVGRWRASAEVDEELLERAVRSTLEAAAGDARGEMSVTLVESGEIEALNRRWLDREGATDVVAFDLGDGDEILGDVYVCPEVAGEAVRAGEAASSREELVRLVIHGTLHVLGHDHPEGPDRWESRMYRLQERLVARVLGEDASGPPTSS